MRRKTGPALVVAVMVLPAACGSGAPETSGDDPEPTASPSATPRSTPPPGPSPTPAATGVQIVVADSEFGPMLFDDRRQAIYLFDVETTSTPDCYDDCAVAWPPVLTEGAPVAGPGADAALLGTTPRRDGATQVTYGGHPLYFYAHEGPGEVECHDVFLNGGNWYVVTPAGERAA